MFVRHTRTKLSYVDSLCLGFLAFLPRSLNHSFLPGFLFVLFLHSNIPVIIMDVELYVYDLSKVLLLYTPLHLI